MGHQSFSFFADIRWHDQLDLIAFYLANQGVGDAGIAGCGIEDDFIFGELAGFLTIFDHFQGRAGFYRTASVFPLGFGIYIHILEFLSQVMNADQRCVANRL